MQERHQKMITTTKLSSSASHASVLLMCGLPGSGKSTLVDQLVLSKPVFDDILVIDYDRIAEDIDQSTATLDRLDLQNDAAKIEQSVFDSNYLEAWRESRIVALNKLKDALRCHLSDQYASNQSLLIIMDDNFHLKSMRREIYRACQEYVSECSSTIGFVTLYVSTPLDVCIEHNSRRGGKQRVPDDVIHKMANLIEPPDPSKPYGSFEKFHLEISNDAIQDRATLQRIYTCLDQAVQSPVQPKNEMTEEEIANIKAEKTRHREESLKCQMQRTDQLLRKLVGAVGKTDKSKSKIANTARKQILDGCKNEATLCDVSDESLVKEFILLTLGEDADHESNPIVHSIGLALTEFLTNRAD